MVEIRNEISEDHLAVRDVNLRAFDGDVEANLVDLLRQRKKALISIVALFDNKVAGHIMFSSVTVTNAFEGFRGIGLAPMAVLPELQNRGIGSQLIREGLGACERAGYDAVFVLGHPTYYPRFGFVKAADYGLNNEYNADEAFMVIELRQGVLQRISGLVKYAGEFGEVG